MESPPPLVSAKLLPPSHRQNWRIEFTGVDDGLRSTIRVVIRTAPAGARPFLQGDSGSWMVIEFWTDSDAAIKDCVAHFEKSLGLKVDVAGDGRR